MLESVIASPEVVHYICKRFDIKMSKKLGQNFLIKRGIPVISTGASPTARPFWSLREATGMTMRMGPKARASRMR